MENNPLMRVQPRSPAAQDRVPSFFIIHWKMARQLTLGFFSTSYQQSSPAD
jgi:hypothetical protein